MKQCSSFFAAVELEEFMASVLGGPDFINFARCFFNFWYAVF